MNSQGCSSLQRLDSAGFLFNRESPFSLLQFKEDTSPSASQSHFLSPSSFSSSTSPIRCQHQYCLTNGKGKGKGSDRPWLTLHVNSRSPKPNFLPLFIGKDTISGTVELDLEKPETVREVKVAVCVVFSLRHCNRLTSE